MKTSIRTLKTFLFLAFYFFTTTLLLAQKDTYSTTGVTSGDDSSVTVLKVPTDMEKEHIYNISYTVKNTGSTTWRTADYKLKISVTASNTTDNSRWLIPNVSLPNDISPGGEATITATVTAWNDDGNYTFTAQMVRNDAPFGQVSAPVIVNIH